jgi:hypothetical protein
MLDRFDEYLLHPTPEPLAHPSTSDRNAYDRYWFNGYSRAADLYFGVALGLYPNRRVMDAAVSVVRGGRQVSVRASRLAPRSRGETRVAPIAIEVLDPLRAVRVRVEQNPHGVSADLVFRAHTRALEEPRLTWRQAGRVLMDSTRLTQFGAWQGTLEVDGERLAIEPDEVLGTRDRSWGVRPVGEREAGAPGPPPQFFFLWSPLQFGEICTHFQVNEDGDGHAFHAHGAFARVWKDGDGDPTAPGEPEDEVASVRHAVRWRKGTRRAERARIELAPARGERAVIELEPILAFQMRGLGYGDPEWGHGLWKGEHAVGGERWVLADLDPMDVRHLHVQQLCRARWGAREGLGILEQLALGPHAPSGLHGILDPAG